MKAEIYFFNSRLESRNVKLMLTLTVTEKYINMPLEFKSFQEKQFE